MKKWVWGVIFASILLTAVLIFGQKVSEIENVIDMTVTPEGNFCYLRRKQENIHLICMDQKETILFDIKLDKKGDQGFLDYADLTVDEYGNSYILVNEMAETGEWLNQFVDQYDRNGIWQERVLEQKVDRNEKKREIMHSMQYIDHTFLVFVFGNTLDFTIYCYNVEQKTAWKKKYELAEPMEIKEMICDGTGTVYFTNSRSQLFLINNEQELNKIELSYMTIPGSLSVEEKKGDLYFTDIHHFRFQTYRFKENRVETIYSKEDWIEEGICFQDVRKVRYENGFLIGSSPIFDYNQCFLFAENAEGVQRVEKEILSGKGMLKYGILAFFGIFILLFCMAGMIRAFFYSGRILMKMAILFTTILFLLTVSIVFVFQRTILNVLVAESSNQLYMLSSSLAANIDGDELKSVVFPQVSGDPYYEKIMQKIKLDTTDFYESVSDAIVKDFYYTLYYFDQEQPYIGFDLIKEGESSMSGSSQEYQELKENAEFFFESSKAGDDVLIASEDLSGQWLACPVMIYDSMGNPAGYLEVGMDLNVLERGLADIIFHIAVLVLLIMAGIEVLFLLIIRKFLAGIAKLKKGVLSITEGNWNVTVNLVSHDEIEEIGNAFNRMVQRVKGYLDSIVMLNRACERFVPSEFFQLMGKESILDIALGDETILNMTLVSVNTKNFYEISKTLTTSQIFEFLNQLFGILAGAVHSTNGVIEGYYNAGLRAVYAESADDAINGALKMMEKISVYNRELSDQKKTCPVCLNIVIQNGDMMLGVVGSRNRMATTAISDEVNGIDTLDRLAEKNRIPLLITEDVYEKSVEREKYSFRYIGKFKNTTGEKRIIALYDCLHAYDQWERENRLFTKNLFESGVNAFAEGDFVSARKFFIDVIRIDGKDELTKSYIFLCDRYLEEPNADFDGTIGNL